MDKKTCTLLADYNTWANAGMNAHIAKLSPAQWKTLYKGYFDSIESQCNHLYISDFNWLKRFSLAREFSYIKAPLFLEDHAFGSTVFFEVADYLRLRVDLDAYILKLAAEVEVGDLEKRFAFFDSSGTRQEREFGGALLHFFNHQTHHRGMISLYLEGLGIENDYSNLIELV